MGVDNDIVALLSGAVQEEYGLEAALEQVRGIAAQHFGLTLSAGISAGFGGLDGVCEAYGSALRAVEQRFLEGGGKDFFAGRLPDFAWDETLERQLTRLEARVAGALRAGNYAQCAQALDTYAQEMCAAHDPSKARQRALLLYASLCQQLQMSEMGASSLPLEMHCQYETLEQMRDDLHRALRVLQERHSGQQEMQRSDWWTIACALCASTWRMKRSPWIAWRRRFRFRRAIFPAVSASRWASAPGSISTICACSTRARC